MREFKESISSAGDRRDDIDDDDVDVSRPLHRAK
jgi:hypothetical protein